MERYCPKPDAPVYRALSEEEHIGSIDNLEKLMRNLSALKSYSERLEITAECYGKGR